eukprot:7212787-Alexandrium_andersonii.AAC.2
MKPGEGNGPSRTVWLSHGRSGSPSRTCCNAESSATHAPHRHRLARHAAFARARRTEGGRGHQIEEGPGQPASGHEPCKVARGWPGAVE